MLRSGTLCLMGLDRRSKGQRSKLRLIWMMLEDKHRNGYINVAALNIRGNLRSCFRRPLVSRMKASCLSSFRGQRRVRVEEVCSAEPRLQRFQLFLMRLRRAGALNRSAVFFFFRAPLCQFINCNVWLLEELSSRPSAEPGVELTALHLLPVTRFRFVFFSPL